jgi:hypothetical protein
LAQTQVGVDPVLAVGRQFAGAFIHQWLVVGGDLLALLAGLLQLLLALVQRRVLALFGELATAAGGEPLLGLTEQGQLVVQAGVGLLQAGEAIVFAGLALFEDLANLRSSKAVSAMS